MAARFARCVVVCGIERDALSEYLVPGHLGFFVYAGARGDFVLGGMQAVFESNLDDLLTVARWSGSASNRQPWEVLIVRDRHLLRQIAEFDGYVVNDAGEIRALSSVCSHMACTLEFRREQQDLRCPCHGARFDLTGRLANGPDQRPPGGYVDELAYPIDLPPRVRPRVRVDDGRIWVWIARA
jgi:nitrite reductase/ring-hydroxylating ferredoxin subunit